VKQKNRLTAAAAHDRLFFTVAMKAKRTDEKKEREGA